MEPGTGKTLTALELINTTNCDYVLFLVPFRTKDNLLKELNKWGFHKNYEIQGIESLSNSDRLYLKLLDKIQTHYKTFIVVDESIKIKNMSAKRTQRILKLGRKADFKLILNGTPIAKNMLDLWSQMDFLSPKILKMSYLEFKNTFCEYVRYRGTNKWGGKGRWQEYIKKYANIDYLYSLIEPYIFDAKLDLNKHRQYLEIPFSVDKNLRIYEDLKREFIESFRTDPESFLKYTTLMQQSYCDEPSKFEAIKKIVDDDTLIFTKFIRSKEAIKKHFPNAHIFTYGKGSLGLNLQQYNKIIFFDKTFDYAQRDQAEHRIYRLGQTKDVYYYSLTGNVKLENTIDKNINKKINLQTRFKELTQEGDLNWENII